MRDNQDSDPDEYSALARVFVRRFGCTERRSVARYDLSPVALLYKGINSSYAELIEDERGDDRRRQSL